MNHYAVPVVPLQHKTVLFAYCIFKYNKLTSQMAQVIRRLPLVREVWGSESRADHISHTLPTILNRCNIDV